MLYTKVFEVFDGSIECGSSVDAINGMADYFNEFGKSVVTKVRQKLLKKNFQISPFSFFRFLHSHFSDLFTFLFQICKKATVAFLDAKISGASKVLLNHIFHKCTITKVDFHNCTIN